MTMTIEELRSEEQHTQLAATEMRCLRDKCEDLIKENQQLKKDIKAYEDFVDDCFRTIEKRLNNLSKYLGTK